MLCVEVVDAAFGAAFKGFLDAGGYTARERSNGKKEFYRFHRPTDQSFPHMIELFARKPGSLNLPDHAVLTPIPVGEGVISLSAILLDEGYYEALRAAKRQVDGVTIIDERLLIPFKARAFLDLSERVRHGEEIKAGTIKKHRNDVFRLLQLLSASENIDVPAPIRADLRRFVDQVEGDGSLDPMRFDVPLTRAEGIALIRSTYGLDANA
ncbi:MAG: hypothetical protein Tsb0016_26530 [Sphingomonadales bacterium]